MEQRVYRLMGTQRSISNGFFAVREKIRRRAQISRIHWANKESLFDSRPMQEISFVFAISRLVLETIQPASPEEKRPAHFVHSPSHTDVTIEWSCILFTYLLTPWSRVLLKKLTASQLVKKFLAFYGTRNFIAAFITARILSLS
jgi:hypothetical protein